MGVSNEQISKVKKKILFVSHDATRTGAPIVLINFLEWLQQKNLYEISILLKRGGVLENSFKAIAVTYKPGVPGIFSRLAKRIKKRYLKAADNYEIPGALIKQHFDLIYINTVECLDMAPILKNQFQCPLICHIHENDFTIQNEFFTHASPNNINAVDQFIAVSNSTKDNLNAKFNVPVGKIDVIYPCIVLSKIKTATLTANEIKKELNLADEFIVGGCGLTSWRKGVDLFVQLAVVLNKLQPDNNIKLLWVGALSHEFKCQFDYEADRLGIKDKVIFTNVKEKPQNYFQIFDVFTLTSREDPFPLVALETAALGKPLLCFDQATGITDFIKNGGNGIVVPYANVLMMAEQIINLKSDAEKSKRLGKNLSALIEQFDVNLAGPKMADLINRILKPTP